MDVFSIKKIVIRLTSQWEKAFNRLFTNCVPSFRFLKIQISDFSKSKFQISQNPNFRFLKIQIEGNIIQRKHSIDCLQIVFSVSDFSNRKSKLKETSFSFWFIQSVKTEWIWKFGLKIGPFHFFQHHLTTFTFIHFPDTYDEFNWDSIQLF